MTQTAVKTLSKQQKLLRAKKLFENIDKKMSAAGITYEQVEKDVRKAFQRIKSRRRTGRN